MVALSFTADPEPRGPDLRGSAVRGASDRCGTAGVLSLLRDSPSIFSRLACLCECRAEDMWHTEDASGHPCGFRSRGATAVTSKVTGDGAPNLMLIKGMTFT